MVAITPKELKELKDIRSDIKIWSENLGSVREGIRFVMSSHLGNEIFDGRKITDAGELAHRLCRQSSEFVNTLDSEAAPVDFREDIRRDAHGMEEKNGYFYVRALERAGSLTTDEDIYTYLSGHPRENANQEFLREVLDVCDDPGEWSLSDRIDHVVDNMSTTFLGSALLQTVNETMIDAAWDEALEDALSDVKDLAYEKGELHAINSAAFYIMVAMGKIPGIDPKITMDGITLFYTAKEEIYEVYQNMDNVDILLTYPKSRLRKILYVFSKFFAGLFLVLLEGGTLAAVFATALALDLGFLPATLITSVVAAVYLSGMAEFDRDVMWGAEKLADELEKEIRVARAKKQRAAALAQEHLLAEESFA